MRILIVNYEFPPVGGGGGIACHEVARELARTHEIHYLTTGFKGWLQYELVNGIHVHRASVLGRKKRSSASFLSILMFFVPSLLKGFNLCRRNRYDLIWSWFVIPSGYTGGFLAKFFDIPHVITIIGGDIYDPSKKMSPHKIYLVKKINSLVMNNSCMIASISTDTKDKALKYYKVKKSITPISLGLVKPNFKKVERRDLGLSEEDMVLISIGRLVRRKGYEYAIKALSKLTDDNVKYLIIGDGIEEENLRTLAKELGVSERVEFLGFVEEERKYQYLAASDIYLLSSTHEGFGIVLLEAMYCGLPIVSTNHGGQNDFLKNQRNALLVGIEDVDALVEKIEFLIGNRGIRKEMGANNIEDVQIHYIEGTAKRYQDFFEELLSNKRQVSRSGRK